MEDDERRAFQTVWGHPNVGATVTVQEHVESVPFFLLDAGWDEVRWKRTPVDVIAAKQPLVHASRPRERDPSMMGDADWEEYSGHRCLRFFVWLTQGKRPWDSLK